MDHKDPAVERDSHWLFLHQILAPETPDGSLIERSLRAILEFGALEKFGKRATSGESWIEEEQRVLVSVLDKMLHTVVNVLGRMQLISHGSGGTCPMKSRHGGEPQGHGDWYELKDENAIRTFTDINPNEIKLEDAELIKAKLLGV